MYRNFLYLDTKTIFFFLRKNNVHGNASATYNVNSMKYIEMQFNIFAHILRIPCTIWCALYGYVPNNLFGACCCCSVLVCKSSNAYLTFVIVLHDQVVKVIKILYQNRVRIADMAADRSKRSKTKNGIYQIWCDIH